VMEALSAHSQREGRPVFGGSGPGGKHLATADLRIWTESKPGAERRRRGESGEIRADFGSVASGPPAC
jgi:hypothetical protein